jgi:outer membrane protein OmpA-like peptidoglycan-associated protein
MMRNQIACAIALGSCLWGGVAFAQDSSTAATAPAAQGSPTAATARSAQDSPTAAVAPAAAADATVPTSGDDVIHLHMPVHHRAAPKPSENAAPAETPAIDSIGADTAAPKALESVPTEAPSPPSVEAPAKPAKSAPTPAQKTAPAIPFSFGEDSATPPAASPPPRNPKPQAASMRNTKTASLPPKPEIPQETTVTAKPAPIPARTKGEQHAGMTKRGAVLFDTGVSNPSPPQLQGVKLLAGDVSSALETGASRVQLEAYGGAPGDKSSEARRLSLKRALTVRQLLIDNGVPSNRIDVRAMGGADDKGPNDRVDVFVRAS